MTIWTIGHSTRSEEDFFSLLSENSISCLADVRRFPLSRRYPHFNKPHLELKCTEEGIRYIHMEELGGRRKPLPGSIHTEWRNDSFRGYADYMDISAFAEAVNGLIEFAGTHTCAIMCSELLWWKCHRALISDYLKKGGTTVLHILEKGKIQEHPFTAPARQQNLFDRTA